jgi:hypothetical protein
MIDFSLGEVCVCFLVADVRGGLGLWSTNATWLGELGENWSKPVAVFTDTLPA